MTRFSPPCSCPPGTSSSGASLRSTRRPASRKSAARAASSGLPTLASWLAAACTASCQLQAAPWPCAMRWQAWAIRPVSPSSSACARKMPPSALPMRAAVSCASCSSSARVAARASSSASAPSASGAGRSGTAMSAARRTRSVPMARPGLALMPCSDGGRPAGCQALRLAACALAWRAFSASASSAAVSRFITPCSAARAAAASLPCAET